ncbi:SET domain [Trypanosoma melophagium]|uniref:SET domain n=1 Tax=Trypanosoma melophagium TaxID=715481 RepID=UPI00351A1036|nr:SET domain [Trypanosoma melophagium]
MVRVRAAWVARQSTRELEAFMHHRAWYFANCGNYAIAADYIIRLLNRKPNNPVALLLGEVAAHHTQQGTFEEKCREAQRRLCVRKNVKNVLLLVKDDEKRETLRAWLDKAHALPESCGGSGMNSATCEDAAICEEQIVVQETEPLEETQNAIRIVAQRASKTPLVELLHPKQSVYGRGLYATTRISSGMTVMIDQPFVVQRMNDTACAHCLEVLGKNSCHPTGVPCTHCGKETYCTTACREAAWNEYHSCCCPTRNAMYASWEEAMRERLRADNSEETRAALCCLAVAKICAMATVQQRHPLALQRLCSLRGRADYDAATALSEVGALAVTLADALHQTHLYMEEVLSLFALVQTNEFLLPSGTALYHAYSFLNHSCEPNCALIGGSGAGALNRKLVTLRDVREGEQLFINYNANLTTCVSYEDRRALCQQRHFECFCPKCVRKE